MDENALELGVWILCFAVVINVLLSATRLWMLWMNKPEKRHIRIETSAALKTDFEKHIQANREEHENLFRKINGVERGLRAEMKSDTEKLHEKVNTVGRDVSGLKAGQDIQTAHLSRVDSKLDRLLERSSSH